MRLAKQIVAAAEKKYGNAPYQDRGVSVDLIVADAEEWESIIAMKLEPVKKALQEFFDKSDVNDYNYAEFEAAGEVLALLSENDGNNKEV